MVTNSQRQETPEYRTFREHYDRLYHAIQDPLSLATQLFASNIITSEVKGKMNIVGLSTLEKNSLLLSAVEMQIQTNPSVYHVFLSALKEDPSMQSLVEGMQSKCEDICQKTPECRTFREHYDNLYHAIQNPLSLATRMYSQDIIAPTVKEQMSVPSLSRLEKNKEHY